MQRVCAIPEALHQGACKAEEGGWELLIDVGLRKRQGLEELADRLFVKLREALEQLDVEVLQGYLILEHEVQEAVSAEMAGATLDDEPESLLCHSFRDDQVLALQLGTCPHKELIKGQLFNLAAQGYQEFQEPWRECLLAVHVSENIVRVLLDGRKKRTGSLFFILGDEEPAVKV